MKTIRQATTQDIGLIHDLAGRTWFNTYENILSPDQADYMYDWMYSEASLNEQMTVKGHLFFIAFDGNAPIGYVSVSKEDKEVFHLHKLYILPEHQGDGTGKFLLNAIFDYARKLAAGAPCSVELNVNRYNKAVSFYKKMGLQIHQEGDFDIGSGYLMTDYIMRIDL